MTTPLHPIPRTDLPRPSGALPLTGSAHVWWDATGADAAARALLSTPKPVLPGLATDRPLVMGIVNVTPDSFSDGGTLGGLHDAVARAAAMVAAGADILDIGGESTRPGAAEVPVPDEIARTAPVIAAIRAEGIATPISIDTRKAGVAEAALRAGADIVNDVSALTWDADLARVTAEAGAPICLMHAQGTPQTMQLDPRYDDVLTEVYDWLAGRIDHAVAQGIAPGRIISDPGIGFGKTLQHNLTLLRGLARFHALGAPILLGASRKKFIGTLSGVDEAARRMPGSVSVALWAAAQGAQIIRVHDVAETVQALALWRALTTQEQA
ncbi:MAG: dihydropteroate synthase [Rhodobacter sp.]|nr:dihydropteroate synthase [Paracoccaceae bacterium]MCC0076024.1 dihydropteroate synthase [Rhodobacter sp.]